MASILSNGAAQAIPAMPRTRNKWMSRIALTWSKHSTSGSVTHKSASWTSRIWAAVMDNMVARIAAWFCIRKTASETATIIAANLARSFRSI